MDFIRHAFQGFNYKYQKLAGVLYYCDIFAIKLNSNLFFRQTSLKFSFPYYAIRITAGKLDIYTL